MQHATVKFKVKWNPSYPFPHSLSHKSCAFISCDCNNSTKWGKSKNKNKTKRIGCICISLIKALFHRPLSSVLLYKRRSKVIETLQGCVPESQHELRDTKSTKDMVFSLLGENTENLACQPNQPLRPLWLRSSIKAVSQEKGAQKRSYCYRTHLYIWCRDLDPLQKTCKTLGYFHQRRLRTILNIKRQDNITNEGVVVLAQFPSN